MNTHLENPELEVIVRTLANTSRANLLYRAIGSIRNQHGINVRAIVVVNGQKFDGAVLNTLKGMPDIILHQEHQASASLARNVGRQLVTAPYFMYLDDDDQLIEDSIFPSVRWLRLNPDDDLIITNGFFSDGSQCTDINKHVTHPLLTLLDENWLQTGAAIFRSSSIDESLVCSEWSHMEWTHMAFEICANNKKIHFMDIPTVRISDTPNSMSKHPQQLQTTLELMRQIRFDSRFGRAIRRKALRKHLCILHDAAESYRSQGDYARAWQCHLQSLRPPTTLRHIMYSRKLIWPKGGTTRDTSGLRVFHKRGGIYSESEF